MENAKLFSIYTAVPEIIKIYNGNRHSTTKYPPDVLFKTNDINLINKALENIKKSITKFNKLCNPIKNNSKCLLIDNFIINDNKIISQKFKKKVNILYLVQLLEFMEEMNI